jgi:hypothetical protein
MPKKELFKNLDNESNNTYVDNNSNDNIIVRLSGQGQFKINKDLLNKVNDIDNSIVNLLENVVSNIENNDLKFKQKELKEKLNQIINLIKINGKPIRDKEIFQSHIIIPNADISINEAKRIFKGEGMIND